MKNLIFAFFVSSLAQVLIAQKKELDVRQISTSEFPKVNGKLWVRNPEGIKTGSVKFYEDNVEREISFGLFEKSDSLPRNKSVLFLVLNSNETDLAWYQGVIKSSLTSKTVNAGDKFAVASFTCKENGTFMVPQKPIFTDNINAINAASIAINTHKRSDLYRGKSQVYLALNEALAFYESQHIELPSGIIILSDERNLDPDFAGEPPVLRSKRLDIPVYSICLDKYDKSFEVEDLCKQTYGLYYTAYESNEASSKLRNILKNFIDRHQGLMYPFSYTSSFSKDGEPHTVKIDSQAGQSGFVLLVPSQTMAERISDNPLQSALILLLIIGLSIGLFLLYRQNKLKKQELLLKQQDQMQTMEQQQNEAKDKIKRQEEEIQKIREEEQRKRSELEKKQQAEAQEKEDEIQFKKMLERGNLPWFEFKVGDNAGSYQIASPRLTVGRDASSDWVIPHPTVSRKHFELLFKDYVYSIVDLNSSNGLKVNGEKVKKIELRHGDIIHAGDLILTFHI